MWTAIVIVAVVAALVIVAVRVALAGRRPQHEPQPEVAGPSDAEDFPEPGEPSPHRADGTPVPGSRDDRTRRRDTSHGRH